MSSIDERIAELQQRIAEKQAFRRMYHPNRNMAIWDYVAEGDRSGFDRIDASETAYHNMLRQQKQQEKMLGLQQAQQEKMLGLQQNFTAKENELNRQNTLDIANINRVNSNDAKLEAIEKELNNLIINKEILEAAGKDSRLVTARINQIYENYPQIKRPELGEYDPMTSFEYIHGQYGDYDSNNTMDELNLARNAYFNEDGSPKFKTAEFAKEIARLDKEIARRKKIDSMQAQIKADLEAYAKTGTVSQLLYDVGYVEDGPSGGRFLQRNGKGAKTYRKGGKGGRGLPSPK